MFEKFKNNSKNKFYSLKDSDIKEVENTLNMKLPKELKRFYQEVGYGFFARKGRFNINRLMGPSSVRDFRLKKGVYEFYPPDRFIYEPYEKFSLYFFEVHESMYFSIELNNKDTQRIFLDDVPIANSLYEFCERISEDDEYYMPYLQELIERKKKELNLK